MNTPLIPQPRWNEVPREYNLRRDAAVLRGPVEWSIDVTNECVGCCLHCFNRSRVLKRDELSDDELAGVVRQIAAVKPLGVCLCGGEPLLRAGLVVALAAELGKVGTSVNMVTTGLLVTPEIASSLADSGMRHVQVSIDGASAQSHERLRQLPGSFDKAIEGIRLLRESGVTVGVSFTPTRFNIEEWSEVYELCVSLDVAELREQPLMPLGTCLHNYDEIAPTEAQYRELINDCKRRTLEPETPIRLEWGDPVDHLIRFGQFHAMIPYTLHVTSDGFLMPSVYLPVVLGNVRRHTIEAYWQAGLARAWQLRLIRTMAYRVRSNRDFRDIRPLPYFDLPIDLDLVDRSEAEIQQLTDVVLAFVDQVSPSQGRP